MNQPPPGPEAPDAPQYPTEPEYPLAPEHSRAEQRPVPPQRPSAAPQYPGAAPQYPGPAPQYPGAAPQHPGAAPQYPGAAPQYPGAAAQYPGAVPQPPGTAPQYPPTAPQYPQAAEYAVPPQHPLAPPAYPQAEPGPVPSGYAPQFPPQASAPPVMPPAPPIPPAPRASASARAAKPLRAPEEPQLETEQLNFNTGRVHMAARQRGADATAVGALLLHVPNFLCSLMVVYILASLLPAFLTYLVLGLWLASGALVFHRPAERFFARYLLNLRYPTRKELEWLNPIWGEVTTRAGIEGSHYDLWIEDSADLNAYAAAGHIVGVTHYSMTTLAPAELAGILAHELGHHTGGHAWSNLLGLWYALPGRLAWQLLRKLTALAVMLAQSFFCLGAAIILVAAAMVISLALTFWPMLLVLVAPYLLAAVGRKAEMRADLKAAELGFAQVMIQVLTKVHGAELEAQRQVGAKAMQQPSLASKLLSSHPDYHTRLRQLEAFLPQTS